MDFREAINKHKQLFPKATVESQLFKLNEEYAELQDAKGTDNYENEYGDLLFVILSLRRFASTQAIAEILLDKYYFSKRVTTRKRIMRFLDAAIKRVEKRHYYYEKGLYYRNKEKNDVI